MATATNGYSVKGTTLRAYLKHLKEQNKLETIRAHLSPESKEVTVAPPLPGSWVDARVLEEIVEVTFQLGGKAAVINLGRAVMHEMLPSYVGVLQGVLKICGASPAFIFKRLNDLLRPIVHGQDYRYTAKGDRDGVMEVRYDTARAVPRSAFISSTLAAELVFLLCSVDGRVGEPEITGPRSARYSVRW
jgi:hypothetical protein